MDTMTFEQQEAARRERLAEVGTEPPCPFCQRSRATRSDYIRCNRCGINWLMEEFNLPNYLNLDPRVSRKAAARTEGSTKPSADMPAVDAKVAQ
jgi:hypothetical protein